MADMSNKYSEYLVRLAFQLQLTSAVQPADRLVQLLFIVQAHITST